MSLSIRIAHPGDAPALIAAIRSCYGESYLQRSALQPEHLSRALAEGALRYALAEEDGLLVGQVALERLNARGLYHHCRAVVSPGWRGQGLLRALSEPLLGPEGLPGDAQLVLGTSVTSHTFTQRYNLGAGFQPLGLVLGVHPNQTLSDLPAPVQAGSAILMGLRTPRSWRPRRLALSGASLQLARRVCASLRIPTDDTLPAAARDLPALRAGWDQLPGDVWRLSYRDADAADARAPFAGPEAEVRWADVPAEHPQAAEWVAGWEEQGFSTAAYLPLSGPEGEDVLRLQRCERGLTPAGIEVADELAWLRNWVWAQHERSGLALVGA